MTEPTNTDLNDLDPVDRDVADNPDDVPEAPVTAASSSDDAGTTPEGVKGPGDGVNVGAPSPTPDTISGGTTNGGEGMKPLYGGGAEPTASVERDDDPRSKLDSDNGYTVAEGDTLEDLALRFYGDRHAWTTIWQANQDRDGGWPMPSVMPVGESIRIP